MQNKKNDISEWNYPSREYIWGERVSFIVSTSIMVLVCILLFLFTSTTWLFYLISGICLLLFTISLIIFLRISKIYHSISYKMDEHSIYYRRGILLKKEIITPINKIYQIKIKQGPILKRFDLFAVEFITAVGSIEITYIKYSIAEYIYQRVNTNINEGER